MKKRKLHKRVAWGMMSVLLASGCAATAVASGESTEREVYPSTFEASGEGAADYEEKLNRFVEEFDAYLEETGESGKMLGYDEPITVTSINSYSSSTEEGMLKINALTGETMTNNRWNDAIKRMFNVDLEYSWTSLEGDYSSKLRLDMASGELPDIFLVNSQSDLVSMAEQGLIWDMTDLIDQYALDRDKEVWASDDGGYLQQATVDGRIYGLPAMLSATDHVSYIWFRDDWMEKLGLEYPTTMEGLEGVMKAFVTQDPDGNGQDDTWGLQMGSDPVNGNGVRGLYAAFGAYPEYWHEKDGAVVWGGTTDETKAALDYMASLYQKGYINPEFVTMDSNQATQQILNEKVGIVYDGHWFGGTAGDLHELNPDARWKCVPLPSATGEPVKSILKPAGSGWLVVNKNFEHPELALKLRGLGSFGVMCSDSAWWWYQESMTWHISPVKANVSAFDNLVTYQNLQEAYEAGEDESLLKAKAVPYWANLHGALAWEWELMFGPGEGTPMHVLEKDYEEGNLFWDPFNGVMSSFANERWSSIRDAEKQSFINIIIGKTGVDEGFVQWMETFHNLGGDQIVQEVNDWYDENHK